jgi:hypothetical protein
MPRQPHSFSLVLILALFMTASFAALSSAQATQGQQPQQIQQPQATPQAVQTPSPATTKKDPPPDKPSKAAETRTPIMVEHQGSDNVGGRLAYQLKELLEKSALFRLTNKDEKKLKLLLISKEEFPGRPNMSSVYSAVWTYSENDGTLKYYLASDVGLISAAAVKEEAEALVGRTHESLTSYSYLFE